MTDDRALIEALRTAGHVDAADSLRDKALARQLRDAGHTTLADALASGTTPPAAEENPPPSGQVRQPPPTSPQADADAVGEQLRKFVASRSASGWTGSEESE